jgi:transcriptional regulator with XRE-family HTH domain
MPRLLSKPSEQTPFRPIHFMICCPMSANIVESFGNASNQSGGEESCPMSFGQRVRELRKVKGYTLRDLSALVNVGFTYLSRVENGRLNSGDYPSDSLIHRLADALDADEEELQMLAERVPDRIRKRVLQRPDVFGALANCDDRTLDRLMGEISKLATPHRIRHQSPH